MNCPQCDREHDAAARFCRGCGATLVAAVPASAAAVDRPCPACAGPLKAGAKFCKQCGASTVVVESSRANDTKETVEAPVVTAETPASRPTPDRVITDASTNAARGRGVAIVAAALVLVLLIGAGVTWRLLRQDGSAEPTQLAEADSSKPFDIVSAPSIVDKPPPEAWKPAVTTQPAAPVPVPAPAEVLQEAPVTNEAAVAQEPPANLAEATTKTPAVVIAKPKPSRAVTSVVAPSAAPAPMKDVALNLVRKGEAAFSQQDYSTAIANARAALDIEPGLARARQLLNEAQGAQQRAMNSISIQ
jgi:hypothetical protein